MQYGFLLDSRDVILLCIVSQISNKWGEVTPGVTLTKCGVWGETVDVITCAIFRDCRLRGVGVVIGVRLPSPIDFTRRPYNTGHTTV